MFFMFLDASFSLPLFVIFYAHQPPYKATEMADSDIYAFLYPNENCGNACITILMPENDSRCIQPPKREPLFNIEGVLLRGSREATEPPDEHDDLLSSPCIVLKFSDGAKTNRGLVMGWDPESDIVLPPLKGISQHHAAFTFNEKNHLVVRDLGSSYGTKVIYDEEEVNPEVNIDWIVGGVEFVKNTKLVLVIHKHLKFRLVVPFHNVHSQDYIDKVINFHKGTADAADLLKNLRTRSLLTIEAPSRTLSKPSGPVYLEEKLGEGAFSIVTHVFNVNTGEQYVRKKPKDKSSNGYRLRDWKKEAVILSSIQHVSTDLVQRIISLDQMHLILTTIETTRIIL